MNAQGLSGQPHDFYVFNAANQVWNGTSFVAWSDAAFASYRVAASEIGTSGDFIAADVAGAVRFVLRLRGDTLAQSPAINEGVIFASPTPSTGPGSALFNPRFLDGEGEGIALALVEIWQGNARIASGTTGGDGRVVRSSGLGFVLLENTEYSMRAYAPGFLAQSAVEVLLSADAAPDYTLQERPPASAPSDPALATLQIWSGAYAGSPLVDVEYSVKVSDARTLIIDGQIREERFVKARTDGEGWATLAVIKSSKLEANGRRPYHEVSGPGISVPLKIEVPDEGGVVGIDPIIPISGS